jgi:hypothetical protein
MGDNCKRRIFHDDNSKYEQEAFDCSSIAFGNAFFAAQEICSGKNWEKIENWTESP